MSREISSVPDLPPPIIPATSEADPMGDHVSTPLPSPKVCMHPARPDMEVMSLETFLNYL